MTDTEPAPTRITNRVRERDFAIVTAISATALLLLAVFGAALFSSGLIDFPDLTKGAPRTGLDAYYNDALAFRERRLTLALLLRTFLTGFSFIVGLALCTIGGVFILRQVTSLTTLAANPGTAAPEALRKTQFSFQAYSPGVVFLLGGVTVMIVTQWLAIRINAVEVAPPAGYLLCLEETTGNYKTCGRDAGFSPLIEEGAAEPESAIIPGLPPLGE